tara:strand:- start:103 stop:420 length:318 start_codon:yes stop_codon:yes gene_type:complete
MFFRFCKKAKEIYVNIQNEDVQICWDLLLRCPEEMLFLDDWIDYLYDESGCSGFNVLTMDILYTAKKDTVMVSFLGEKHICNRFILLEFLRELRHDFDIQKEMRG